MHTSPGNKKLIFSGHRDYTVNLVVIIFTVLAVLLVGVGTVSFVGAREIEKNYSLHLSKTIEKLELVNQLHLNNDNVRSLITDLTTPENKNRSGVSAQLKAAHDENTRLIKKLNDIVVLKENKKILRQLIVYRQSYYTHTDSITTLALNGRIYGAKLYSDLYLAPVDDQHQLLLNRLSANFQKVVDERDTQAAQLLASFVDYQEIILALILIATACSIFLIQYLFRKLKRENLDLSNEITIRQELQNELFKSQHIYKTLFDSNPIPMWIYDFKTLRILKANNAASEVYGYTLEEFLEIKISDLKLESDLEHYFNNILSNPKQHSVFQNIKHKRKDGSEFRVEVHSHALPEEDNICPRLVVAVNVDEQFMAHEKIERNEMQLREISSSIPGAVYQFRMTKELKYSFPFVSAGIQKLYGVTPEEIYETPSIAYKNVHPEDVEAIKRTTLDSYIELKPWIHEFRVWQAEHKKYLWVRGHSLPTKRSDGSVQWNGTFIDITNQKEAQEELVKNEANLKALLDSSNKAIFLLDADLLVMSFNKVAADYVLSECQITLTASQDLCQIFDKDLFPDLKEDHAMAMQGHEISFETGTAGKWYEIAYKPAISKDNQVLAVALSIHDITEQRDIIEAIRKSEAQLTKAQTLTKLGSWEYDIENKILSTSESLCEIYGLPTGTTSLPYSHFESLYHPDDAELPSIQFQKAAAGESSMTFDHRIVLKNGQLRHLHTVGEILHNLEGKPVKISGATQDITELKLKEQELIEAKEKLQATLENIPEIIFSTDARHTFTYISPQVQTITGYREADLLGNPESWKTIVHQDDIEQVLNHVTPALLLGNKLQYELRIVTKEGATKWIELRCSPVLDANNKLLRTDGSAADITDKKLEEVRRMLLTEQLQKQNHHLQQFTYIVSHNLRAPIANIIGLTSIYDHRRPEAVLNQRVIDNLTKSAQLLDSTIRDLNDILSIRNQINESKEVVDFNQTLEHIIASVAGTAGSEEADIDSDFSQAPDIIAIRSYVYSIMLNLVTNAIKYRSEARKLKLQLRTFRVLDYICLEVQDNGQGINMEQNKDKIFGLYKRFHQHQEGKGIGLHLVKTQAELLGGKVEVDSEPDLGSKFKVYLKHQV
ncbi:PAS domain S-box protein [Pontibacter cellulosilyticus]|uniref:histidine kinase n=1 Tax=Pontibacter cellulosilyticus TaxID=1720253 RepID=A0A923N9Q7_9BACT|nr:PAS domain S-box protein [Pontibacter cellulosilyticus]MBC5994289.1 PAS domain-containing protein [Pontibacter cellulosilyticus]